MAVNLPIAAKRQARPEPHNREGVGGLDEGGLLLPLGRPPPQVPALPSSSRPSLWPGSQESGKPALPPPRVGRPSGCWAPQLRGAPGGRRGRAGEPAGGQPHTSVVQRLRLGKGPPSPRPSKSKPTRSPWTPPADGRSRRSWRERNGERQSWGGAREALDAQHGGS